MRDGRHDDRPVQSLRSLALSVGVGLAAAMSGTGCAPEDGRPVVGEGAVVRRGVIRPPEGVDPGILAPTPWNPGAMRVIPPPGSPGGDPWVEPR
jgi:hypothetical protein